MKEISIDQLLDNDQYQCIDVRSPIEFQESHIPGAINVPIFTDGEREEIGTIYKQQGSDHAKWRAMELVSPKIPHIMKQIRDICEQGKEPVIYCWRGGMRSKSVTIFASLVGLHVARLTGGYKSYRHYILEQMETEGPHLLPNKVIVFHGLTGIGKTELLHRLAERGWPVLDLEQIANHRGSVFGAFGHWQPHNQKTFDSLLYKRLLELKGKPLVLIEAESKRVGRAVLPDFIMEAKDRGDQLLLTAELSVRVDRTYKEYVEPFLEQPWLKQKAYDALNVIDRRMPNLLRTEINQALEADDYKQFIQLILENYYDPMYAHKQEEYLQDYQVIDISDLDKGLQEVEAVLQATLSYPPVHQLT